MPAARSSALRGSVVGENMHEAVVPSVPALAVGFRIVRTAAGLPSDLAFKKYELFPLKFRIPY